MFLTVGARIPAIEMVVEDLTDVVGRRVVEADGKYALPVTKLKAGMAGASQVKDDRFAGAGVTPVGLQRKYRKPW